MFMFRSRAPSHPPCIPKATPTMAVFFRKKKLPLHDLPSHPNLDSNAIHPSKPHLALSVPRDKLAVHGICHKFACKARLFRRFTWGKLQKKPIFRHPNLFSKDPGVKLLKSIVSQNRGIQRIRRILQGQGVTARKSICQPDTEREARDDHRNDGDLELCKKRILIGYKCRPLARSGTLRYDQNGILLPEFFP